MRRIALLAVLGFSSLSEAGERYLGSIVSAAGADTTNATTTTAFFVPLQARITLWCSATAYVLTDTASAVTTGAGAQPGMPLIASEKFPTSTAASPRVNNAFSAANGGAIVRIMGPAAVTCHVYARTGTE